MSEIGIERGDEGVLPRQNGFLEFRQVVATLSKRRRAIAQEGGTLTR
jgi:hypothetical protein